METVVREFGQRDLDQVVGLSLRAWEPVFASFEAALGPTIFRRVYPDWRAIQARAVAETCSTHPVWVATVDDRVAGFVAATFPGEAAADPGEAPADPGEAPADPGEAPADPGEAPADPGEAAADPVSAEPDTAEIEMIAVDPELQRLGLADRLIATALERMRERGVRLAVVATGGDPGHAPARAAYEKAGFTPLPLVRYYLPL